MILSISTGPSGRREAGWPQCNSALKVLRNALRDGNPANVVFDRKTLAAIARTAPTTRHELFRILGVGLARPDR